MPDGKSHRRKPRRSFLGLLCLLLLLLLSSVILVLTIKDNEKDTIAQSSPRTTTPATTTPTLTPSVTLNPTPTPFFFDNFTDNSKAWTVSRNNDTSGYQRVLNNNQLILKDTNRQTLVEALPTNATYDDFILTTTFTVLEGDKNDSIGFYLRGNVRLDRDYRIDIFGNNTFSISKEFLTPDEKPQTMTLQEPAISSLLKPKGEQNTLTVMMKGPYLLMLLNGRVAASVIDSDYTEGQIALFARNGTTSSGVAVAFDTIEVKPVPQPPTEQTPTPTGTVTVTATVPPQK